MNPTYIKAPMDVGNLTGKDMQELANRFVAYMKPFMGSFFLGSLAAILHGAVTGVQPYFIKIMIDDVLKKGDYEPLKWLLSAILGVAVLKAILMYVQGYWMIFAGQSAIKHIRNKVYAHIQSLPITFFEKWPAGQIMYRIITDTHQMTDTFTQNITVLISDFFVFVFAISAMFYTDWKLTLIAFLSSPIIAYIMHYFGSLIQKNVAKMQSKISDLNSLMQEHIGGIKVIKAFCSEEFENKKFEEINENSFVAIMKSFQFKLTQVPLVELFGTMGIMVIVAFGAYLVKTRPDFTAGSFLSFVAFMLIATSPLNRFSSTYAEIRKGMVSAARVFELMDIQMEQEDSDSAQELPEVRGEVEFKDVKFSYDGEHPILKGISFTANPGETIAIVGPNGSGKTTLINLIPRFYNITGGDILIDGKSIKDIKLTSLRSHIGVVLQDTVLFSGTIKENIAYANPETPMEKIIESAKIANAHNFIMELPEKYDTRLGIGGVGISGGQRQQIAIARTVLRNPKVLILDEATSALDQKSEALVQSALERIMKNRTTFIIAHRLNTIQNADRIVVLKDGLLEETGKHNELMSHQGLYYNLYNANQKEVRS